jgi:PadR family transcriptional regulator, regulatory protein PadR
MKPSLKSRDQRDLFPGALEMMILQTLKRSPMHGYALAKQIKQSSDWLLEIEEGSLYPALQRMLKQGWVQAEWVMSATNRRVRMYRLTGSGARHLEQEVSSFERMLKGISQVLAT